MNEVYVTSSGSFLPGEPIDNESMEAVLGAVHGQPSRLRARVLKSNGIRSRHYAMDTEQRTTHQNSEMAAAAIRACTATPERADMLAVASTQGDLPLPGLASMVQAELGLGRCEILSTHGVCSAGMMALKAAANEVRLGQKEYAVVCASELASRLLKRSRYEAAGLGLDGTLDFEAEFLRWMPSDGAGALLLEPRPAARGPSLRVDWIDIVSYASDYDSCMYCGTTSARGWSARPQEVESGGVAVAAPPRTSWQDYPTYAEAERSGALLVRQDVRLLENIVKVGVDGFLRLLEHGRLRIEDIDHMLCHYSAHHFRGKIMDMLKMAGAMVAEERWFTNLYTRGNTGCASIFVMLDELFRSGRLRPGQGILCVVPESGRFAVAYMKMTVVA